MSMPMLTWRMRLCCRLRLHDYALRHDVESGVRFRQCPRCHAVASVALGRRMKHRARYVLFSPPAA